MSKMSNYIKTFKQVRKERREQNKKDNKRKVIQYTKKAVSVILFFAIVWITWNYGLATYALITFQDSEPLAELSSQVCTTIIGVCIGYFTKAFLETLAERTVTPYLLGNNTTTITDEQNDDSITGIYG